MSHEVVLAAALGAIVGSFLNVVALRWQGKASVLHPPSHCPLCQASIRPWDNIPVLSWLLLGGKCRDCKGRISPAYPATEAATAAVAVLLVLHGRGGVAGVFDFLVLAAFIAASRVDFAITILPDGFLVFAAAAALLAAMVGGDPEGALAAGLAGAALLAVVYAAVLWLGSRAFGQDAMGWGDVKMAAVVGLWLGPGGGLAAAAAAVATGAAVGLLVLAWHRLAGRAAKHLEIPFGPFIAAGALAALLWPGTLAAWWAALRGLGAG